MLVLWLALAVLGFVLILFLIASVLFPNEIRVLFGRIDTVEVQPTKFALKFYEEAAREKEDRPPPRERSEATLEAISGGRILWVDDVPINNRLEVKALHARGVAIDCATSNEEAVAFASTESYSLILSDIGRKPPEEPEAGLALPEQLRAARVECPIAFYTGRRNNPKTPTGEPVFDMPRELFEFIADQLGRDRTAAVAG